MREHPHPFRSCNRHHRSTSETGWSPFRRGRIGADSASVLILNRRKRAPNLRVSDRIIAGLCTLLMRPAVCHRSEAIDAAAFSPRADETKVPHPVFAQMPTVQEPSERSLHTCGTSLESSMVRQEA